MRTPCELKMNTSDRQPVGASVMFLLLALLLSPGSVFAQGANPRLRTTFTNPTPAIYDNFGWSLTAVGHDRVLIGTSTPQAGAAYLFALANPSLSIALANGWLVSRGPNFPGSCCSKTPIWTPSLWTTPAESTVDDGVTQSISFSPASGSRFFRLFKP